MIAAQTRGAIGDSVVNRIADNHIPAIHAADTGTAGSFRRPVHRRPETNPGIARSAAIDAHDFWIWHWHESTIGMVERRSSRRPQ